MEVEAFTDPDDAADLELEAEAETLELVDETAATVVPQRPLPERVLSVT